MSFFAFLEASGGLWGHVGASKTDLQSIFLEKPREAKKVKKMWPRMAPEQRRKAPSLKKNPNHRNAGLANENV